MIVETQGLILLEANWLWRDTFIAIFFYFLLIQTCSIIIYLQSIYKILSSNDGSPRGKYKKISFLITFVFQCCKNSLKPKKYGKKIRQNSFLTCAMYKIRNYVKICHWYFIHIYICFLLTLFIIFTDIHTFYISRQFSN